MGRLGGNTWPGAPGPQPQIDMSSAAPRGGVASQSAHITSQTHRTGACVDLFHRVKVNILYFICPVRTHGGPSNGSSDKKPTDELVRSRRNEETQCPAAVFLSWRTHRDNAPSTTFGRCRAGRKAVLKTVASDRVMVRFLHLPPIWRGRPSGRAPGCNPEIGHVPSRFEPSPFHQASRAFRQIRDAHTIGMRARRIATDSSDAGWGTGNPLGS